MSEMKDFRGILRQVVSNCLTNEPIALLFSGGTDSLTLFWTLLDLGANIHCYTFRLERVCSIDSKVAMKAATYWAVPITVVLAPYQEPLELVRDVQKVIRIINSPRKTHVEVMWPYWTLFQAIPEQQVWSGLQADTLYGSGKSMSIKYNKDRNGFNQARRAAIANRDTEGLAPAECLAAYSSKQLVTPYTDERIREFMLQWSWQELNRPCQKMPAVIGFANEFCQIPLYRKNDNMQCGSGVREYMARMLNKPAINSRSRKSPARFYKDLHEGIL